MRELRDQREEQRCLCRQMRRRRREIREDSRRRDHDGRDGEERVIIVILWRYQKIRDREKERRKVKKKKTRIFSVLTERGGERNEVKKKKLVTEIKRQSEKLRSGSYTFFLLKLALKQRFPTKKFYQLPVSPFLKWHGRKHLTKTEPIPSMVYDLWYAFMDQLTTGYCVVRTAYSLQK